MMKLFLFITISLIFVSCSSEEKFNESAERQKILEIHNLQREYHFNNKPEEFVSLFSGNFISVNGGEISTPGKEESIQRFKNYFNSVKFIKWDDITPPVIKFSDDGTMAYSVVNKEVILENINNDDNPGKSRTIFSWVTIYKKYGEKWKIDFVASTNKAGEIIKN